MELTGMERMLLLRALPAQGNLTTIKIVREMRENLSFNEADHEALGIDTNTTVVNGPALMNHIADIQLGKKATEIAGDALRALDEKDQLTEAHLSVWEKFFPDDTPGAE